MSTIKKIDLARQLSNLHNLQKVHQEDFGCQWRELSPQEQSEVIEISIDLNLEKNYDKK